MPAYKYKATGYILALLVGGIGAHHFYYRNYRRAIIYLLFSWTFIPVILGWIDMIYIGKWNDEINKRIIEDARINHKRKARGSNVLRSTTSGRVDNLDTRSQISDKQIINLTKEDTLLISNEIILPKYAHLITPKHIEDNVRALVKPSIEKNQTGFISTYSISQRDFAKDSFKYRNKKQSKVQEIPLKEYWTTFSKLNERQLKWYFYWREQVIKGNYLDVDLSYLILFTYELINYTFNQKAAFNVSMLVRLHDNYVERIPQVANYLPDWISDMLLELDEQELAREWRSEVEKQPALYSQLIDRSESLERISIPTWRPYLRNLRETVFFLNNKNKVYKTFKESVPLLKEYHEANGDTLEDVWFEKLVRRDVRPLYRSAVMARNVDDVHVYSTEYAPTELLYNEVTTLFKIAENVTRLLNGEKREIKVEEGILPDDFQQQVIERLEKAKRTNKRFKVVQEISAISSGSTIPQPINPNESDTAILAQTIHFNDVLIEEKAEENRALQKEFLAFFERDSDGREEAAITNLSGEQSTVNSEENSSESNEEFTPHRGGNLSFLMMEEYDVQDLGVFIKSLTNIEVEFLALFENKELPIQEAKLFLKQQGQLPGMILSTINEKAEEFFGDILLDETSEYIQVAEEFGQVTLLAKERVKLEN